ncbi:hypothetical protein COLO4_37065 [Corchorus olitorius]|uniref:Mitochondrial proton/calcium exchanger protein n=1 Tax=Corchorus olitorius TaxID=93759 RepID=A0A1R3G3J1_9ROSI|nr:hypothetical protein COLO4_37065 [Corchorus olitorius]
MAKEVQNSRSGEIKKTAEDLDDFLNKVRKGSSVSNEEILGFAKLFNDELTLDNINRIKNDDKLIQAEGVESLSEDELREDCRERGMLGVVSVEEMRQQKNPNLPKSPTLKKMKERKAFISGKLKPEDAVRDTLTSLPDEVVDTVGITALPSEDSVSERRRKLEYLEMQEELIKSVSREREEFLGLVNKEVDAMLQNLEKEIDDVDAKIGDRWRILDRDHDGKVTPEEVAAAAIYLKDTLGKEGVQELISNLSKDRDGKILVEDIVKLGSQIEEDNSSEEGRM